jgi:hypothetical protein
VAAESLYEDAGPEDEPEPDDESESGSERDGD